MYTKLVQSMVRGVRHRGNIQREEPTSERTHIELSEILLFFMGVVATVIASAVTCSVFPASITSYVVAFLLSGIVGGVLTGSPIWGSISGLMGGLFFTSYMDGEPFLWVYLLYFVGGFIGGITGKILCTRAQQVMKKGYLKLKFRNYIGIIVGLLFLVSALIPVEGQPPESTFDPKPPSQVISYFPFIVVLTRIFASLLVMVNGRTKSQSHPSQSTKQKITKH